MRQLRILWLGAVVAILGSSAAAAQTVELTPFVGYRFGGEIVNDFGNNVFNDTDIEESESYGLILGIAVGERWTVELIYDSQATEARAERGLFQRREFDVDIDYFHVGASFEWDLAPARPYVAASVGLADFDVESGRSDSRFSASFGGGVKIMAGDHFGVRLDGRWYAAFIEERREIFCGSEGCVTFDDEALLYQWDAKVGLIFSF